MKDLSNKYTYGTSNTSVVTLSSENYGEIVVTAVGGGTATITVTATVDGVEYIATCEVTVNGVEIAVTGITLNKDKLILEEGQTDTVSATLYPSNATNTKFNWHIDESEVIDLISSSSGTLTLQALKEGTATLTATTDDGGYQATCEITVVSTTSESEFTYTIDGQNVTITGYTGSNTEIAIPSTISGKTVTTVGNGTESVTGFESVTAIVLPETVTTVSAYAFSNNTAIEQINLRNITSIGEEAFYYCTGLNSKIVIPDTVTNMGMKCFYNCTAITGLQLSKNCKEIPIYGFAYCRIYEDLIIPDGIETIWTGAFEYTKITGITFADSVKYIYQRAFQCNYYIKKEIELPKYLVHLGDYAFNHCYNITNTKIVIPATVETLGGDAPSSVTINGVQNDDEYVATQNTGIGTHMFFHFAIYYIEEFIVEEGNTNFKAVDGVLYSYDGTRLIAVPSAKEFENGTFEILEGVTTIDELSFSYAGHNGTIGNLKTIVLPNSYNMPSTRIHVYFGGIHTLSYGTFNQLSDALYTYTGVSEVLVKDDNPYYQSIDGCLYSKDGTTLYLVPPMYEGDLVIEDGTTTITNGSFFPYSTFTYSVHTKVTSLYIPASVTSINQYALTWINKLPSACTITVDSSNPYWQVNDSGDVEEKTSTTSTLSLLGSSIVTLKSFLKIK